MRFKDTLPQTNLCWIEWCRKLCHNLQSKGISIIDTRFPFTYHHDFARAKCSDGESRSDIAERMRHVEEKYGLQAYWLANILGAIYYLNSTQSKAFLDLVLNDQEFRVLILRIKTYLSELYVSEEEMFGLPKKETQISFSNKE